MSDADTLEKVRVILRVADLHRNREKRDALEMIRSLLGIDVAPAVEDVAHPRARRQGEGDAPAITLDEMTKQQLVELCLVHGLDAKGNKPDLIERLRSIVPLVDDEVDADEETSEDDGPGDEAASDDAETPTEDDAESDETPADESERQAPRVAPDDAPEPDAE